MTTTRMFDTDTAEVTKPLADDVLESIEGLKRATADLERVVKETKPTDAIAHGWLENMRIHFDSITCNVCRINGAVLVRAKD